MRHIPDQPQAKHQAAGESDVSERDGARSQHQRRRHEQTGDHDADGEAVAGSGQLPDHPLEALQVELNRELASFDRVERLAEQIG